MIFKKTHDYQFRATLKGIEKILVYDYVLQQQQIWKHVPDTEGELIWHHFGDYECFSYKFDRIITPKELKKIYSI